MQWISPYNIYLLIFFSAGGETKESDRSKDTTLVSDKPNQGERSRRPLAFFWQILPCAGKQTLC